MVCVSHRNSPIWVLESSERKQQSVDLLGFDAEDHSLILGNVLKKQTSTDGFYWINKNLLYTMV